MRTFRLVSIASVISFFVGSWASKKITTVDLKKYNEAQADKKTFFDFHEAIDELVPISEYKPSKIKRCLETQIAHKLYVDIGKKVYPHLPLLRNDAVFLSDSQRTRMQAFTKELHRLARSENISDEDRHKGFLEILEAMMDFTYGFDPKCFPK